MKYLCILFLLLFSFSAIGNNIRVEGKTRVVEFLGNDTAVVEVTLLWDNSWRDDFNWDAAWIFFKYKKRGMSEGWKHVYLGRDGHEAIPLSGNEGGNYMFMFGEAGVGSNAKVTGLYVVRDEISEGKVKARLRVKWSLSANGLTKSDFGENMDQYYIAVHAIEMVYIPYGAYSLGDGFSGNSFVDLEKEPLTIDSEDARNVYTLSSPSTPLSLSSSYPKGYAGFYVMKYEVSQEQYVEFLNSLTLSQQKSRVGNNDFEHMEKGDYVFGDLKRPNCRNGIAIISQPRKESAAVFGNNLNRENDFFSVDDGQTLACNYLSPSDMLAYCDWSGLRPMSELEYEKACRRPYPQVPEKGEYAWNTSSGVNSLQSESELSYRWSENEQAVSKQKNVNSGGHLNGPVRCGLFATSSTSQSESGATYWGVMDMGGNLWEMCYNAESAGSKFVGNDFSYSHGDGVLDVGGNTDISASYWPSVVGAIGVRGGSFASSENMLRTSDRSYATGSYFASFTTRDSSVGFRGARGVLNTTGFDGGAVLCPNGTGRDTTCISSEVRLRGVLPNNSVGKLSYVWYLSEDNGVTWELLEGEISADLSYRNFVNTTSSYRLYKFKRKSTCAVGEAEAEASMYVMPLPWTVNSEEFINPSGSVRVTSVPGTGLSGSWTLQGAPSGLSVSNSGSISGIATNSIARFRVEMLPKKCPDIVYEKDIIFSRVFAYTGGVQSVTLKAGKYQMECWGAAGETHGGQYPVSRPGYGGYTKGEIVLSMSYTLYAYVGSINGYNGGGVGEATAGGGTDIRLNRGNGDWGNFEGLKSRIMVAGGGGGGSYYATSVYQLGHAGGLQGYSANICTQGKYCGYSGKGATQTAGGAPGKTSGLYGQVGASAWGSLGRGGIGPNNSSSGGGGGYYGGGHGVHPAGSFTGGGGGSSFISGHAGCNAISASSTSTSIVHTGQSKHYSGLYFTNTVMIDGEGYRWTTAKGAKIGMPNLAGTGTMTGNAANGQVKITPLR